jgi:circadian clock protein KaiC
VSTGVGGFDEVLTGGLLPARAYMLRGPPGAGKTILGTHFLTADPEASALYVAFEESAADIRANAAALGIDLDAVTILDLSPTSEEFLETPSYDLFEASGEESSRVTREIRETVDRIDPDRVFVDPLTHLRKFAPDGTRFRTEVAGFMRYLGESGATVVFTTQPAAADGDDDLQFMADGTVTLDRTDHGRTLTVEKFRGSDYLSGAHAVRITDSGLRVFPQLTPRATETVDAFEAETLASGIPELDALFGGGIERGTVTIVAGPSGVGKTTTGAQFLHSAVDGGDRAAIYLFEESLGVFTHRSDAVGIPVSEMRAAGSLRVEEVEPLTLAPAEFAQRVRTEVEERGAEVVMIDGVAGYGVSIRGESGDLRRELHALCRYLRAQGVTVLLTDEVDNVTGEVQVTSERTSYLADNIAFIRYFEARGEIRKAIGVLKKRTGDFERTLREFRITTEGIVLGDPLSDMRGVLTGTPDFREARRGSSGQGDAG